MFKQMILLTVFTTLVILASTQAIKDEQPPVWANQFEQDFTETFSYPLIGKGKTSGNFFYDFTNERYRVDRVNGKWDRYCGSVKKFKDTPCTHYVTEGKRYLDFPKDDYCCYCCDNKHGCGILKPNWLEGAQYKGLQDSNGQSFHVWDKPGLQSNLYWATADKKILAKMDQQPNDLQEFDPATYKESITDPKVFDLPSRCNAKKTCPWVSTCTPLRLLQ